MIGIIGAAWLAVGTGIWVWLAWQFDERDLAISVLPIIVLLWPAILVAVAFQAAGDLIIRRMER